MKQILIDKFFVPAEAIGEFTKSVTKELIDAIIEANPQQFICLDSAFHGNDQLKANAVQTFNTRNMQKEKHNQIVFRTV